MAPPLVSHRARPLDSGVLTAEAEPRARGRRIAEVLRKAEPAVLLANPDPNPVNFLRRFVHVRFTGKVELKGMVRGKGGLRPEVRKEIEAYLRTLD